MNNATAPAVQLAHVARFSGVLLAVHERWQPLLDDLLARLGQPPAATAAAS